MSQRKSAIYSTSDAARAMGITLTYLFHELWAGRIPGAHKQDGKWQIPRQAVEERRDRPVNVADVVPTVQPQMSAVHLEFDLGAAAFLIVRGFSLVSLEPDPSGRRFAFRFDDPEGAIKAASLDYFRGASAPARDLISAEKYLKSLLYAVKPLRNGHGNEHSHRNTHR
jgi:hypothetical protein